MTTIQQHPGGRGLSWPLPFKYLFSLLICREDVVRAREVEMAAPRREVGACDWARVWCSDSLSLSVSRPVPACIGVAMCAGLRRVQRIIAARNVDWPPYSVFTSVSWGFRALR